MRIAVGTCKYAGLLKERALCPGLVAAVFLVSARFHCHLYECPFLPVPRLLEECFAFKFRYFLSIYRLVHLLLSPASIVVSQGICC